MKEIKAFIHRARIADVVRALRTAGFKQMSFIDVQGTLRALSNEEREYSIELGQEVITETKLELYCEDEQLKKAIDIIRKASKTSQSISGWIYVSDSIAIPIESSPYGQER
jgi:nitrogen regulatory protein P-II 1